jgi:DNA repair protein RecN (Recombination protein N)
MLFLLRIKNFALIDRLELEFGAGLNVLTGETGAGKSIILDAIDIALGGKVNSRLIRTGTTKAILEASFQLSPEDEQWLNQQEIELFDDGSVVCSRELTLVKGTFRSRCRVNGVIVNRHLISQLRDRLLEITAQGQTGQLMVPAVQRDLLDAYGGHHLLQQRQLVACAYEEYQKAKNALETRLQSEQQRLQRLDLLKYQIKELKTAQLDRPTEIEQLEIERERLSHIVELQQLSYQLYQLLYQNDRGENAAADILGQAELLLRDMVNYDRELESVLEMVQGAINQVVEAGHQIYGYGESLEADPERLAEVEVRISLLKRICRKYGPTLAEAIAYYHNLQEELVELTKSERSLEELEQEEQIFQEKLTKLSQKLTELRQQAATKLEQQLMSELKPLAMEKVSFECHLTPRAPNSSGAERIQYYFSPNPGEQLQPLSSTASGGEMSRFLLALKACFSQSQTGFKTLIFDEIDAGVSGKVAQAIAEKLNQLSQKHQVLCVTHQPLIAAMADAHFRVEKQIVEEFALENTSDNGQNLTDLRTVVRVKVLDNQHHRRDELAELTGGHSASEAIAFANSLLETAAARKSKGL